MTTTNQSLFDRPVLGHPAALFVVFFTEMWERFSFYGMRVLLVNFLTMSLIGTNPGWGWNTSNALALYGTYAGLLYITPIIGGMIADKLTGARMAVMIGAIIMTLGHASMAFETESSMYLGLALLVIGTGFFKPNMPSIISEMYKDLPEKKDGAYTIFYMGVNAGAFFGMMMCGYLAEKVGWSWGFGLAGIFMLLGSLQFWLAKPLFGNIGERVDSKSETAKEDLKKSYAESRRNPFTWLDILIVAICSIIGLLFLFNDPLSKIGNINILPEAFIFPKEKIQGQYVIILIAIILFFGLLISRISRYDKVTRNRMTAVAIFAVFVVFFWMSFEQGASTLVIFARDFTERNLTGTSALIFNIINALLTIVPLSIITYVLIKLFKATRHKILSSNIILGISFSLIWMMALGIVYNDFTANSYKVEYIVDGGTQKGNISTNKELNIGETITAHQEAGRLMLIDEATKSKLNGEYAKENKPSKVVEAQITDSNKNQAEITTSWFSILNSFFIIALASLFSKLWDSKYNPPAAIKYGMGLVFISIGFGILAIGASAIPQGAEAGVVRISLMWLVFAYLFHTMGELCLSPVGLSYVSKLVPARMISFMFGVWYLAIAVGQKLAASVGGVVDRISAEYSISGFFLIFTIIPLIAGLIIMSLTPFLKKLMGGVK